MKIKNYLDKFKLNKDNCIVVGSGILKALNLRENKDIDVITTKEKYEELLSNPNFEEKQSHGHGVLTDDLFEISIDWTVLDKTWTFKDLTNQSIIIDDVRYTTIEFLLKAKKSWIEKGEIRQKDLDDVQLMEDYLLNKKRANVIK
ncbi:MAG: hypothetical protein PHG24_03010 [Candidatus Pacebacteria bacterium]|nr:hypothetical protein [Candidatus Paceibacterota bacterium]